MGINVEKREQWMDVAKCLAIFAVLIDHANIDLLKNYFLWSVSFYSVSVFIFIMGITTYKSLDKRTEAYPYVFKRIISILIPYIVSSSIYTIISSHGIFDFSNILTGIIYFNRPVASYYVLLFIQFLLISPIMHKIIKYIKSKQPVLTLLLFIIMGILIVMLSIWSINYTNILEIYGGGGKLFGGSFLIVLYVGMLFGAYYEQILSLNKWVKIGSFVVLLVAFAELYIFICKDHMRYDEAHFPFGNAANPPGPTLIAYSLVVAGLIFLVFSYLQKSNLPVIKYLILALSFIGSNTMYIYLYHVHFLEFFLRKYCATLPMLLRIIVFWGVMIGGSIALGRCFKKLRKLLFQKI